MRFGPPWPDWHARTLVWVLDREARFEVPFFGPGGRNIFLRRQNLARLAIDDEEEAVSVGLHHRGHGLAVDLEVGEQQLVDAVIVPGVGRGALHPPFDLSGVRVERQRRGGVEVGQLAVVAVAGRTDGGVPRTGVRRAPEDGVGLGIVGPDQPGCAAAVLGRVAPPAVAARLVLQRNGVGPPDLLASIDVIGLQRAAHAVTR